ncbi:MAG: GNAT family N-acetyltransferase [Planctomycetota bacterium]
MGTLVVAQDDPLASDVLELLSQHLSFARGHTPIDDAYALEAEELADASVSFFSIRDDGVLQGIGALRALGPKEVEVKSMHTAKVARRRGMARRMLEHLIAFARESDAERLFLETGAMEVFAPARALYRAAGFVECEAFGDYGPSDKSVFMTLDLQKGTEDAGPRPPA